MDSSSGTSRESTAPEDRGGQTDVDLGARVAQLQRRFGRQSVFDELSRLSLAWLLDDIAAIQSAFEDGRIESLFTLRPQALYALLRILQASSQAEVEASTADLLDEDDSALDALVHFWKQARPKLAEFQAALPGDLDLSKLPITTDYVDEIGKRLESSSIQKQQGIEAELVARKDTLDSLQAEIFAGRDVSDRLAALNTEKALRDALNVLASIQLEELSPHQQLPSLAAYAKRYSLLVRVWREFRLSDSGRINHPVQLTRISTYYDFDMRVPCVELRIVSASAPILYIRDQVDDVLWISAEMIDHVAEAARRSLPFSEEIDGDVLEGVDINLKRVRDAAASLQSSIDQMRERQEKATH